MKKTFILLTLIQMTGTVLFLFVSLVYAKNISRSELYTVQNLAGAVISDFPDAEPVFIKALQNPAEQSRLAGEQLLSSYGYDRQEYSLLYLHHISSCIGVFGICLLLILLAGFLLCHAADKQKKAQEQAFLSLLERCLDDDYSFLDQKDALFSPQPSRFVPFTAQTDIFTDTFLKLAQKLRLKTEALAKERDNTKSLVTDISHQIKTPLAALKTCFSLYLEADTPAESEEFLLRCRSQIEKLEILTASLIGISRLEAGMISLSPEKNSLTEILVSAVNAVYDKADTKQISIDTEDFRDIRLMLDKKWTAEALFNLLDNAVKYSPDGSRILIRVQELYSFVRMEIEDQGIGIPKEEYNRIFRRFYRGENETVKKTEGSGVGLYLARKILEEQGGTISVKAARERGCIFVVQFPL